MQSSEKASCRFRGLDLPMASLGQLYLIKTLLASISAFESFTHCHGVRGFRAFASSGFAFASLIAVRSFSRASRGSILSSSQRALSVMMSDMLISLVSDADR